MPWSRRRESKATSDEDSSDFAINISRQLEEEEEARQLTRQFYKEVEYRQNRLSEFEWGVETYDVRDDLADDTGANGRTNNKRTVIKTSVSPTNSSRRTFANQSLKRPSQSQPNPSNSYPLFPPFWSFPLFSSPAPSPATSAGLFSGGGATVYSSGRSLRAEFDILESTIKSSDLKSRNKFSWNAIYIGNPEQMDQAVKLFVGSLILLSVVYLAAGMPGNPLGGIMVVDLSIIDEASSCVKEAGAFVEVIFEGAAGGVIAGVGKAGEAICWLEESAAMAGSAVEIVARSVEELVIGA